MLLPYDPDKISFSKILLKTIPNIYITKFPKNKQLIIKNKLIVFLRELYYNR